MHNNYNKIAENNQDVTSEMILRKYGKFSPPNILGGGNFFCFMEVDCYAPIKSPVP